MKTLTAAALALVLATPAFAQQTPGTRDTMPSASPMPPSIPPGNEGEAFKPRGPVTESQNTAPAPAGMSANASADSSHFRMNQAADQWLVGNIWHKNVYNAAGQSIGDVNDILVDKDGRIAAVVVGVGGFLGLGEKNVAVDFNQLQRNGGIGADRITIGMSEQDLRNAPQFNRSPGSGSSSTNR